MGDVRARVTVEAFDGSSREFEGNGAFAAVFSGGNVEVVYSGNISVEGAAVAMGSLADAMAAIAGTEAGALAALDAVLTAVQGFGGERFLRYRDRFLASAAAAELELEEAPDGR